MAARAVALSAQSECAIGNERSECTLPVMVHAIAPAVDGARNKIAENPPAAVKMPPYYMASGKTRPPCGGEDGNLSCLGQCPLCP